MDILEAYFLNADGGTEKTPSVGIQFGVGASTHVFKNVSIFIEPRSHITFFNPYTSVLKPHASALFPIQAGLYFDL
jgi:hypothetical protein